MIHRSISVTTVVLALGAILFPDLRSGASVDPNSAPAQGPASLPRYLIYPVTTELQRQLLAGRADMFVVLDTTEALQDDKIAPEGLNLNDLRKDLAKLKKADTRLQFSLVFKSAQLPRGAYTLLRYAVIGLGHEIGFRQVTAYGCFPGSGEITWAEHLKKHRSQQVRPAEGDETARGDEEVKVYPVRTELTRYLSANADCAVVLVTPFEKDGIAIPAKYLEVATKAIAELKLTHKKKVHLSARYGKLTERERDRLTAELRKFGAELGFEDWAINI